MTHRIFVAFSLIVSIAIISASRVNVTARGYAWQDEGTSGTVSLQIGDTLTLLRTLSRADAAALLASLTTPSATSYLGQLDPAIALLILYAEPTNGARLLGALALQILYSEPTNGARLLGGLDPAVAL